MLEVLPESPGPRTLVVACDALAEEGLMFDEVSPFVSLDEICFILIYPVVEVGVATTTEELFVAHLKEVLEGVFDVLPSLAPVG